MTRDVKKIYVARFFDTYLRTETLYPNAQTARDADQAHIELKALEPNALMLAYYLLCFEECEPENEASVIRSIIDDVIKITESERAGKRLDYLRSQFRSKQDIAAQYARERDGRCPAGLSGVCGQCKKCEKETK